MNPQPLSPVPPRHWGRIVRDAALVVLAAALLGLGLNALRPASLPLRPVKEYDILVPCPDTRGEAKALTVQDPLIRAKDSLFIDARGAEDYAAWHPSGALNVVYDWLDPLSESDARKVSQTIAKSGAKQVLVYGDGADPDSGPQLALLISEKGIRNVYYVQGGAPALQKEMTGKERP